MLMFKLVFCEPDIYNILPGSLKMRKLGSKYLEIFL